MSLIFFQANKNEGGFDLLHAAQKQTSCFLLKYLPYNPIGKTTLFSVLFLITLKKLLSLGNVTFIFSVLLQVLWSLSQLPVACRKVFVAHLAVAVVKSFIFSLSLLCRQR